MDPSSSTPPPLCSQCKSEQSKYTCPRCHARTCSLPCSKQHKFATGCTGVRDPVKYVPMNKYGWGNMMDDYSYLEGVGRKVGEWGQGLGKLPAPVIAKTRSKANSRGRGRGGKGKGVIRASRPGGNAAASESESDGSSSGSSSSSTSEQKNKPGPSATMAPNGLPAAHGHGRAPPRSKLEQLQQQLALREIHVDFLPEGMAKRRANRSFWNVKWVKTICCYE